MYIHHPLPYTPLDPARQAYQWNPFTAFLSCGGVGRARFGFYFFCPSHPPLRIPRGHRPSSKYSGAALFCLSGFFLILFSLLFSCLSWACCSVHEDTVVAVDAQAARGLTWGGEVSFDR